jgi:hypothetical protein
MSVLNKRLGLSHGKVSWMFEKVFGLKIDRSTSARSGIRTAKRCAAAYEQIRADVRAAEEVTPDETGWRVGGGKAWLHAFATARTTCYEIDPTRSGDVAERLLGLDWSGRLVHDGWSVYDRFLQAIHQQCNAHLLNRCKELLEVARRGAVRFPLAVKGLLQQGLAVRDRFAEGEMSRHGLCVSAGRLTARLERTVAGVSRMMATGGWRTSFVTICVKCLRTCVIRAWLPRTIAANNRSDRRWSIARSGAATARGWGPGRNRCSCR